MVTVATVPDIPLTVVSDMLLTIRYPDKPKRIEPALLQIIDGNYIATAKYDGWRTMIDWDGSTIEAYSRRGNNKGGPNKQPISPELTSHLISFCQYNNLPPNTRLDAEWMKRRHSGNEYIVIIGIQYLNGQWIGDQTELNRWNLINSWTYNNHVVIAKSVNNNYFDFFKQLQYQDLQLPIDKWEYEGIVLKQVDSKLIGSIKESAKNPNWFKVKWRESYDGKLLVV